VVLRDPGGGTRANLINACDRAHAIEKIDLLESVFGLLDSSERTGDPADDDHGHCVIVV
jgi:hypothetical protein